ncbi:alpha/beta hydrolase [Metarhizobium album]|uniref:Alpha/beta hydrolase n=1 Tax=Metarhizobium album TaxID=2182425 RepID=A0A2U2DY67_9HYPH|nr:alpha/beta hydrolase [Rhizobium album]PWE58246.1 alpha/beta hydrolase [Rhizobium album]
MTQDYESGFSSRTFHTHDGLKLYARDYGYDDPKTAGRTPLVCLPGLTRNSRDFHQLAVLLSSQGEQPRRVVSFDYRGRGFSDWDNDKSHYNLLVEADDVIAGCAALGIENAVFLGTSRGGLTLHLLAGMRPALLKAVILNDIGPVIEGAGLAQIKAYLNRDEKPRDWQDAVKLLQDIHGRAFTALTAQDWVDMAYAIYAEIDGKVVGDFDPAIAQQMKDLDLSAPVQTLWQQFDALTTVPLMVIRGENSALLSEETIDEIRRRHPRLTALTVAGHGHAPIVHLSGIPEAILRFIGDL